ncbi:hypothetical protein FH972_024482 [Carpinus fangiana]|uniref:Uncharacterized protein n=1 Tax=Carpinus fangiana TaxID=176857 RepID=A0A5N6KY57_9ROSI|nr:hypothetical protein FH972_024482 [Carpinus fangiana]
MVNVPSAGPSAAAPGQARATSATNASASASRLKLNGAPSSITPNGGIPLSARRAEPLDLNTVERRNKPLPGWREPTSRQHFAGIKEAPTFRPTADDWRDPMEYMRKIAPEGSKYGICKIVPPDGWDPDFAIDTTKFHFKTRKQELNFVEGGSRTNLDYLDKLGKFHKSLGINFTRFPSVDKRPLDLYELKKAVESRGGFEKVCKGKKWAEIGRILGYSGKIMSSLSTSLKNSYGKWLEPYERYLAYYAPNVRMQTEQERGGPYNTPSPGQSPMRKSAQATPSSLNKEAPAMRASFALNGSISEGDVPAKKSSEPERPSSGFTAVNAGSGFTAVNSQPASSSFTAVNQRVKHESESRQGTPTGSAAVTPVPMAPLVPDGYAPHNLSAKRRLSDASDARSDAQPRSTSNGRQNKRARHARGDAPNVVGSQMLQPRSSTPRSLTTRERGSMKSGDFCEKCERPDERRNLLECSGCDDWYHMRCLDPPLRTAPEDWHCPKCLVGTGEFGFEEGGIYSLKNFQEKSSVFKEHHFMSKVAYDPILDRPKPVTEDDVEREFWRLVTLKTETVEVEYGADIHSTTHGSGFPTMERNPRNPYTADPWNLNVLPLHQESLFRYIKSDISGMTVPWLYVGMVFSTFCWHNEDHYAYSANYQHFGATKTWYGIPGASADAFENAMKEAVPELFESQPDLLFQLVTLLSPDQLEKARVPVYACDQRAGEYIITFPKAYHAGFNHGFNFNEAVNFAPADWEPWGEEGVQRLGDFRRQPCFSHDMLLMTAASQKDVPIKTARWLAPALQRVTVREKAHREAFHAKIESKKYIKVREGEQVYQFENVLDTDDYPEEEYTCAYCKGYAYLSRFWCEKTGKIACLDHIEQIECCNEQEYHEVHMRVTDYKLDSTLQRITEKASLPDAWQQKFDETIADTSKPQLKVLRGLLAEGERIPWDMPSLAGLKAFVDRCNDWVDEATSYITRKQQNRRKSKGGNNAKTEEDPRNIKNIKKLLDEADLIGFDCPEIATLQERAEEIVQFQQDARKALLDITKRTSEEIEELIQIGKGFYLEIPEVEVLEKLAKQIKWQERAKDRKTPKTLQDVGGLLKEATELGVPEHNENLLYLQDQKHRGEIWEEKAKELMSVENVHFVQLDSFSKQAADLPVSRETLAAIDAILKKQREAQDQIMSLVERCKNPDFSQRPKYAEVNQVMEALGELNSKPPGTIDLEKEQKRHEDWMRRGKKLFGKSNAPLHILHQHLQLIDNRNKGCFDLDDRPSLPVEPSSRANTPEDLEERHSGSQRNVFCLCRKPEAGMMIECAVCHEWYHSKCLKIARGKIKDEDDFTCPICDYRVKIPRDAERPKLEELMDLQSQIPGLPFQPDEEDTLESIIDTAQKFRDHVQQFVNPIMATVEEIPLMRFHLRKIEGADLLLSEETNFFRQELHRLWPIAPEPPPIIEKSKSTRKPRPTKQQKLMAAHGVDNPDDLPPELRTKQLQRKSRDDSKNQESQPAMSRGSSAQGSAPGKTQTLNFRQPLTASTFPHKQAAQTRHESPLFSQPSVVPGTSAYASPGSELPRLASPFAASPESAREGNLDPGLFNSHGLEDRFHDDEARPSVSPHRRNLSGNSAPGDIMFDPGQQSAGETTTNFDSMFADLTNHDEHDSSPVQPKHDEIKAERGMVDPALLGDRLFES